MRKKLLSIFLAAVMMTCLIPASVMAEETTKDYSLSVTYSKGTYKVYKGKSYLNNGALVLIAVKN